MKAEIRFELCMEELSVLDGYCNATGRSRTEVVRELLAKWSKEQLHVAMVICRTAQVNPMAPEGDRRAAG